MKHPSFPQRMHSIYSLLGQVTRAWMDDNAPRMGAALAFYTIFSLAPSLIIAIGAVGLIFGQAFAEGQLALQMNRLIGTESAQAVMTLIQTTRVSTPTIRLALFEMGTLIVA